MLRGFRKTGASRARAKTTSAQRRRSPHGPGRHLIHEFLEPRHLLSAGPLLISELMAANRGVVADEDGAQSDWIEIYNPTDAPVSLDGWYLTDDADLLTKWEFPSVSIDAGAHLVVFASSKDRVDPLGELHTNFNLSSNGEYLALVQPDGTTISHDYAGGYPELGDGVSFGLPGSPDNVIYHVPTSADATDDWTAISYDDDGWDPLSQPSICVTELGTGTFDYIEIQNLGATAVDTSGWKMVMKQLSSSSSTAYIVEDLPSVMNPGQIFYQNNSFNLKTYWKLFEYQSTTFTTGVSWTSHSAGWAFIMDDEGNVVDFVARGYTEAALASWSVTVDGHVITADSAWLGAPVSTSGSPILSRVGSADTNTAADFSWGPASSAWFGTYFGTIGAHNANLADAFVPDNGAIGFAEHSTGLNTQIGTDVSVAMQGANSSIWTRREFVSDGPTGLTDMTLRIRYSDGFVAYLNGVEIARANAPTTVAWNSAATASRTMADAVQYVDIDVSAYIGELVDGVNVLAVQGLNNTASDGNFLIEAELVGVDSTDAHRYFFVPTPGERNGMGASETDALVDFSHGTGVYYAPFELTLTTTVSGAVIRYTLDQSDPTETSPVYTGPITISNSERVRAAVFVNGQTTSLVASESFFVLDSALKEFDSNLNLVVIDTHGQPMSDMSLNDIDYTTVSTAFFEASGGNRASLGDTPAYTSLAGLKWRGTYSLWLNDTGKLPGDIRLGEKPSYRLELRDELGDDQGAALFGMPEESDWILYSLYDDGALMRDYLSYQWYDEMGHWAPSGRYIELYVNEDGGTVTQDDYVGLYLLLEKIEVGDQRVDIDALDPEDNAAPEVTGGYIFKKDRIKPGDTYIKTSHDYEFIFEEPGTGELTQAQRDYLLGYMNTFESVLYGANFADPVNGYAAYIDVDSFIDMHIMQEISKNWDGFKYSMYYYKDVDGKIKAGPLWDMNITFGVARSVASSWTPDWYHCNPEYWHYAEEGQDPYYPRLFSDPEFAQKYVDRMNELLNTVFAEDKMMADMDVIQTLLTEAQQRHFDRWPNLMGEYVWPQAWWGQDYEEYVTIMRNWIHARLEWVQRQYVVAPGLTDQSGAPIISPVPIVDPITVDLAAPAGTIYYTTDGTDPRLVGGGISPSAVALTTTGANTQFITSGSAWYYLDNGSDLGLGSDENTLWHRPGYDYSSWASGLAQLGYGDGDEATVVSYGPNSSDKYITTYFAKTFNVTDASAYEQIKLELLRDDAAVVYINGKEVARHNTTYGNVYYDTLANQDGTSETTFFPFLIDPWDAIYGEGLLVDGTNVIAVEVHQSSPSSSDLSFDLKLTGIGGVSGQVLIDDNARLMARALNGTTWSGVTDVSFVATGSPIRVTEVMYDPPEPTAEEILAGYDDNNLFEFIELVNTGETTVSLTDLAFTNGITYDFSTSSVTTLAPGQRVVVVKDLGAFAERYGTGINVAGVYSGKLANEGERVTLEDSLGVVQTFKYDIDSDWPGRAEGKGASIEVIDTEGDLEDGVNWRSSTEYGGSPGEAGMGPFVDIVVNEVLTHPAGDGIDAIELYNTTNRPINIGGWYLSDSSDSYHKFQIPANTIILAGGYLVFDEDDFRPGGGEEPNDFAFSGAHGDDAWLMVAESDGTLVRFADHVDFGPAANGESFGRWPNGSGNLYPMESLTLGAVNSEPRIGPVVISEVHYQPEGDENATWEYVELYNPTGTAVDIGGWQLQDGITFEFASGTTIAAYSTLLVVTFDPAISATRTAFETYYSLTPGAVAMVGSYAGSLSNGGETVELRRPDTPPAEEPDYTPYLLVDAVTYDDVAPWPTSADGLGDSLHRGSTRSLGDMADGWVAAAPTPGTFAEQTAVVARHTFYNNSKFDNTAKGWTDDQAIATDKTPLLPGQTATFANYTSFDRGLNGIMIDVMALDTALVPNASDFLFRVGNGDNLTTWTAAPTPASVSVRLGAGVAGSDRITITWADGAIQGEWLEVTALAAELGLPDDDVFYFGNAPGESGDAAWHATVSTADIVAARDNARGPLDPAMVTNAFDFNRDGLVNATDMAVARQNMTQPAESLQLITPDVPESAAPLVVVTMETAALHDAALEDALIEDEAEEPVAPTRHAVNHEFAWAAHVEMMAQRHMAKTYGPQPRVVDRVLLMDWR